MMLIKQIKPFRSTPATTSPSAQTRRWWLVQNNRRRAWHPRWGGFHPRAVAGAARANWAWRWRAYRRAD